MIFLIFILLILADRVAPESITSDYVSAKYLQSEINTEFIMFTEQWEQIPGYNNCYYVSNFGDVKRKNKCSHPKTQPYYHLKARINNLGYAIVALYENKQAYNRSIHTLVWDAFGDRPRDGRILQVDHIDNNKTNNHIDNLQLLSHGDNMRKAVKVRMEKKNGVTHSL